VPTEHLRDIVPSSAGCLRRLAAVHAAAIPAAVRTAAVHSWASSRFQLWRTTTTTAAAAAALDANARHVLGSVRPRQQLQHHDADTSSVGEWYADSGADAHMVNNAGILSSLHPPSSSSPSAIIVGNGASLPVTSIGSHSFPTERLPLVLSNVLVSPSIIKNLISVHVSLLIIIIPLNLIHLAFL
jgi:hypothetical protein